jgi:hypothetical protein
VPHGDRSFEASLRYQFFFGGGSYGVAPVARCELRAIVSIAFIGAQVTTAQARPAFCAADRSSLLPLLRNQLPLRRSARYGAAPVARCELRAIATIAFIGAQVTTAQARPAFCTADRGSGNLFQEPSGPNLIRRWCGQLDSAMVRQLDSAMVRQLDSAMVANLIRRWSADGAANLIRRWSADGAANLIRRWSASLGRLT